MSDKDKGRYWVKRNTVKLFSLRGHQKAVVEEKGSPNATKVHRTKQNRSIYDTFNNTLLSTKSYVVGTHLNRLIDSNEYQQHSIILKLVYLFQVANVFGFILIRTCKTGPLIKVVAY